jgi:16S rRNA pseudouridine516 synthase
VDGGIVCDGRHAVCPFNRIELAAELLQAGKPARYLMLHKPPGVVSATRHAQHRTVLDLLPAAERDDLHLVGRLDLNTSGLLLLSNDGHWSRQLSLPASRMPKVYRLQTEQPINPQCIQAFACGIHLPNEDITTLPAELEILASHEARLTLHEGRHHQIKRMFAHFHNKVTALHRERIGPLHLGDLPCAAWRPLTVQEVLQLQPAAGRDSLPASPAG